MSGGPDAPSLDPGEQRPPDPGNSDGAEEDSDRARLPLADLHDQSLARLAESERRTQESLDRMTTRLEEAEARANQAEAKAERAQQLAQQRIEEKTQRRPLLRRRRTKRSRRRGRTRALLATAVKPRIRTFIVLAVVGLPLLVGVVLSQVTTDYLFFRELDQEAVSYTHLTLPTILRV